MPIGTNRIRSLTPVDCIGRWEHPLTQVFGCTVYDAGGGAFTLRSVTAVRTTALGVITTELVHDGAAFQANWNGVDSTWNPATGVMTLHRTGGYADGMTIRFTVVTRDGAGNDTYSSWTVGIGNPPDTADPPAIGDKVRVNGQPYRVTEVVGVVGSLRYSCEPMCRAYAGRAVLRRNDFEYISPRGRLDATVTVSE